MTPFDQSFLVAIGGSAGSLRAIIDFFDYTPLNNASYVIIRHMPKSHISRLKEILVKHSKLRIVNVYHSMRLKANTVYIGPCNENLVIEDGQLKLVERKIERPNYSVDLFFQSLAKTGIGKRAIAIILSGIGSDGSKGVRYIKEFGGIVIAQTPGSCQYSSMPESVIKTSFVDFIDLPANIPKIIQQFEFEAKMNR